MTKHINRFKSYFCLLLLIILFEAAFLLVLHSTYTYGPASTHDSVAYMYAAKSLIKGNGLIYFGYETPFVQWPPVYPFLLSLLSLAGDNLITVAGYANAVIFAAVVFASGCWILNGTGSLLLSVGCSVAMLVSIPLTYVSKYIWSEPLFILSMLLFMILLERNYGRFSIGCLIGSALLASLCALTRYIGVTSIITGCIMLLFTKRESFIQKIKEILIFGSISSVPVAGWLIRNYILTKTLTGSRPPAQSNFWENVTAALKVMASWFGPEYSQLSVYIIMILLLFFSIIACIISGFTKEGSFSCYRISILLVSILVYFAYLVVSASVISFDNINSRLLSPVYVPFILMLFFALNNIVGFFEGKAKKAVFSILFILVFLIGLVYPMSQVRDDVRNSYENGSGILASRWWTRSKTLEYIKELQTEDELYSNFPDAVYYYTGKRVCYTPKKEGPPEYGLEGFKENIGDNTCTYIAWFNLETGDSIYHVEELAELFSIEEVEKFPDGTIYRIIGLRGSDNDNQ